MARWDHADEEFYGEGSDVEGDIRLNLAMVEMIRTDLGDKKAAWAQTRLNIPELDYSMCFRTGMWLRYAQDPVTQVRLEILDVRSTTCLVYCVGWDEPSEKTKDTLCRYRVSEPPTEPLPSWVKPGACFIDDNARWCIRTLRGGMFTAMSGEYFNYWTAEELARGDVRPIFTAWEQLDDLK
jgi:hypothetical protein